MNTTNSLSNTSLLYNRGGYSIKNDSVAISANLFQMLKSALIKLMLVVAIVVGGKVAWGQTTGTIEFGNSPKVRITSANATGDDNLGNTWAITTEGTDRFTSNADYYQVGTSDYPATSITFTTTLPTNANIVSMSAKFGGYSSTAGDITLNVGNTTIGTGSLNGVSDVVVESTSTASSNVLTVNVTNILRGVKVYYISYTYVTNTEAFTVRFVAGSGTCSTVEETESSPNAGVSLPTDPTLPGSGECSGYEFYGWSTTPIPNPQSEEPELVFVNNGRYYPADNTTLYAIYLKGENIVTYNLVTDLSTVTEGKYYLLTTDYHAFNGTISSGHGQTTSNPFSFTNEVATTVPTGALELTFTTSGDGFKMHDEVSDKYLYAIEAKSGKLDWHASENSYWKFYANDWYYNANRAHLRTYNGTIRTYNGSNNQPLYMAKKVYAETATYATYPCSSCTVPTPNSATAITLTSATISWTSTEDSWEYYYSENNIAPTTSGIVSNSTSVNLTGLSVNTTYYWWVRTKCGDDNYSDWIAGPLFHTDNYTITPLSNNDSYGTVSLSGTTITANPICSHYGTPAFTVSPSDAATVTKEGDSFLVSPNADCTITIMFVQNQAHTVTFHEGANSYTITETSRCSGINLPNADLPSGCDASYTFCGWSTELVSETTLAPATIIGTSGTYYPENDIHLYAVFSNSTGYKKITNDLSDWSGTYLIVYEDGNLAFDGSRETLDDESNYISVAINNGEIESNVTNDACSFVISRSGENYTIKSNSGYYIGKTADSNGLNASQSTAYTNTITYDYVDNVAKVQSSGGKYLMYNSAAGQTRFRFISVGCDIQLYRKQGYYASSPSCDKIGVIYNANGATSGRLPVDNTRYTVGDEVTVLGNGTLAKDGYEFAGWNTAVNGSGTSYIADGTFTITANTTLYAQWTISGYTISWVANGQLMNSKAYSYNSNINVADVPEDDDITIDMCDGTKVFVGWAGNEFEETNARPELITRSRFGSIRVTEDKSYFAVFAREGVPTKTCNLVSDVSTLSAGDSVIIVSANSDYAISKTQNSNNRGQAVIVKSGSSINYPFGNNDVCVFEIGKSNGYWTFYDANNNGYIYAASSSKNYLRTEPDLDNNNNGYWNITISNTGIASIVAQGTNTNRTLQYNSGSSLFSCYSSASQSPVALYEIENSGSSYSAYTTFCPCAYGIDGISNGDLVWAGKNANADWNSTINWTRYNEGGYHLTATAPTSSNNVYIIEKAECEIDALPHINENTTCNNLTMLNGLGIDIAENQTLTINGTATFTNGVINGNVIFGSSATVSGASASSHVDGIVTKSGAANGFTFPTGSNGNLGKVEVTDGSATNVSVQYFSNPAGFGTNDLPRWWNAADMSGENPFNHVSNVEYWKISSNETITANFVAEASTDMHFNSETAEEDRIPANIQMAFYDNNRWTNVGGSASIDGNTLSINGAEIPASATRGISGNYTTFGSKSKSTVLPIELVSFTANCNGRSALIEWTTATEKNNDFFVLERSHDAVNFKEIARVAGAGNSIEPISYAYTDFGVRNGNNYYRLVQVDYDGTSTASEIIVANCLGTDGEPEVLAYPNPFGDDITLRFENFGNIQATVEVYDMLGRMVHTQKVNCSQNDYEVVLRLAGLSDGTYNVRISANEFVLNRQVIKN